MSTLTSILALLKKSPTTDGADVFNLDTILNDNWDKVDAAVGAKYGVCGSAAATAAKTVTIAGFTLLAGVPFTVKFTNGNSAAALTLNVSSTGAKSVKCRSGATLTAAMIPAGHVASLCYDGAAFWLLNPADLQEAITAAGVLKGTGSGVAAAARGTDYSLVNAPVTVSIPYTGWVENTTSGAFEQSVAVTGLLSTDDKRTRVEIVGSTDIDEQALIDEAAANISYVACNTDGYLYLRCDSAAPETTFSASVVIIR